MEPPQTNDPLSAALQEWRVRPVADPQFRPAVWDRIAARSRESWAGYVRGHRLMLAAATVAVVVVSGWTGHAAAQARIAAERDAMVTAYLVELDPRVQAKLRP